MTGSKFTGCKGNYTGGIFAILRSNAVANFASNTFDSNTNVAFDPQGIDAYIIWDVTDTSET